MPSLSISKMGKFAIDDSYALNDMSTSMKKDIDKIDKNIKDKVDKKIKKKKTYIEPSLTIEDFQRYYAEKNGENYDYLKAKSGENLN